MSCRADPEISSRLTPRSLPTPGASMVEKGPWKRTQDPSPTRLPPDAPHGSAHTRSTRAHVGPQHSQAVRHAPTPCSPLYVQAPPRPQAPVSSAVMSARRPRHGRSQEVHRCEAAPQGAGSGPRLRVSVSLRVRSPDAAAGGPPPCAWFCPLHSPQERPSCSRTTRSPSATAGSTRWHLARVPGAEGGGCGTATHPPAWLGRARGREALSAHLAASEGTH